MLSVVITANKVLDNTYERNVELLNLIRQYKLDYEIIYVCNEDYADFDNIATIVSANVNHKLIVLDKDANLNTEVYAGLTSSSKNDVLLLTADTNLKLVAEILAKRKEGYENVFVRKKQKPFKRMLDVIGTSTYHLGQLLMGRANDLTNDANVMLIDARNVNTIIEEPALSKVLRITNQSFEKKYTTLQPETIHDQPTIYEQIPFSSLFALGVTSITYYLALFFMAVIFPLLNSGVYSWYMLIAIVLWITLGLLASAMVAKQYNKNRMGEPVPLDLNEDPTFEIKQVIKSGDIISYNENKIDTSKPFETKEGKKSKSKKTADKNIDETTPPKKTRGRPAGAKNKKTTTKAKKTNGKRGRPAKTKK